MSELMRWESDEGPVVVEVDSRDPGFRSVSRRGGDGEIHEVEGRFESALNNVRGAAMSALRTFRDRALDPETIELEFGVKLSAVAGAVIAKTAAEGHLTVKLTWSRRPAPGIPAQGAGPAGEQGARPPEGAAPGTSADDGGHGGRQDGAGQAVPGE